MKDKKDKQCRFIFTAAFAHIYKGANIREDTVPKNKTVFDGFFMQMKFLLEN